jgi:Flp pilus assembly protein TadG
MAALSIDVGTLYQAKAEAQRAADAAALAAARVISVSGVTGDPNTAASWQAVCGTSGTATLAAKSIAQAQWNFVNGVPAPTVTVTYGTGTGSNDCSTLVGTSFSVNPIVRVYVQQPNVPTFFGRIFALIPGGTSKNSGVSGTATAEAFNPSGSGFYTGGNVVPVWPRCVKPWVVPDADPVHRPLLFVNQVDGSIVSQGISLGGVGTGVIGESFNLVADCSAGGSSCTLTNNPPVATPTPPTLQYVPALVQNPSPAASQFAVGDYQQAIAGCDNTTLYQCGDPATQTQLNLGGENPFGPGNDSATAAEILIYHGSTSATGPGNGQDVLLTSSFPFQIMPGSLNPLGISGTAISSSTSIVSLPIYQSTGTLTGPNPPVTIVGFLQVFINWVNADGSVNVTVLNVSGCSNTWIGGGQPPTGSSPVPVRLITPPVPAQ